MRTAIRPQSVLRHPFSVIFGTEAAVRVLRELSRSGHERAPAFLAERTGVTIQTVRRTLERLVTLGVVDVVGQGRYPSYRLSARHPLRGAIDALFEAEAARAQAVFDAIRSIAEAMPDRPEAMWVYGSVARAEDTATSDLDIAVVFPNEDVEAAADALRAAIYDLQGDLAVSVSVIAISPSDVLRLSQGDPWWRGLETDAFPLIGAAPRYYAQSVRRGTSSGMRGSS
jgi:predicted nucleotidyltransferase